MKRIDLAKNYNETISDFSDLKKLKEKMFNESINSMKEFIQSNGIDMVEFLNGTSVFVSLFEDGHKLGDILAQGICIDENGELCVYNEISKYQVKLTDLTTILCLYQNFINSVYWYEKYNF